MCRAQSVLPCSESDVPGESHVKLYCPSCEDLYTPKSSRHASLNGAYFGTSIPFILLQTFPQLMPARNDEIYVPKIYGFMLHETGKLVRWREKRREQGRERLKKYSKEREQEEQARRAVLGG